MPATFDCSRRGILLSALAALSFATTRGTAANDRRSEGCFIAPEEFRGITMYNVPPTGDHRPLPPSADFPSPPSSDRKSILTPIVGTYDGDFDRALGRVLVQLSGEFGVAPGFGYYDDGTRKNAFASPMSRIQGTEGTVLCGIGLLNSLRAGRDGDSAILAVCAHEFAHILQFQTGEWDRIKSRLRQKYCRELYADFLAGYFLGLYRVKQPSIGVQGVGAAWEAMGSSDFNNPGTHGTSQQRVRALEAGYAFGHGWGHGVDRAMSEAYSHVAQYG